MRFVSTRGDADRPTFYQILLGGIAPDGGLYLPEAWPTVEVGPSYPETVARALAPYLADSPLAGHLNDLVGDAYSDFRHPEVVPLRRLSDGTRLLELYWGPTLAFKDHALQMVGRLFDRALSLHERRVTVLVATSGDTGSAAIAACQGAQQMDVVVLFPQGRVSEFQRRQMTTVASDNVRAVAVEGTFDDCQDLVKSAFADRSLPIDLAAMNSINFARIAVQAAYYLWAADQVSADQVDFVVPTGNFGNVFSGWAAQKMGGPIGKLIIANNENRGLASLVNHGSIEVEGVFSTLAPSMDIQIPSNLERYLYELSDRDADRVRSWQQGLRATGRLELPLQLAERIRGDFAASWFDDQQILEAMARVYETEGILIDPHTSLAWLAGREHRRAGREQVVLATADPVKFAPAVVKATGHEPPLPAGFAHILTDPERQLSIPKDYSELVSILKA